MHITADDDPPKTPSFGYLCACRPAIHVGDRHDVLRSPESSMTAGSAPLAAMMVTRLLCSRHMGDWEAHRRRSDDSLGRRSS